MADSRKQDTLAEEKNIEHIKPCKPETYLKIEDIGGLTPTFDGKISCTNYVKQFEAAARVNNWSKGGQ